MTLYSIMNLLEALAIPRPIELNFEERTVCVLELGEHDDRYCAFMSQYGLYNVISIDIDSDSASYVIRL